jgi:hypothetical protein
MKHDDPKRLKLRAAREAAHVKLEILRQGIAATLKDSYITDMEELIPIVEAVNIDLVEAMKAYERATEAYRPFMSRRRLNRFRPRKKAA